MAYTERALCGRNVYSTLANVAKVCTLMVHLVSLCNISLHTQPPHHQLQRNKMVHCTALAIRAVASPPSSTAFWANRYGIGYMFTHPPHVYPTTTTHQADEPAKPTDSPQYTYARLPIEGPLGRSKVGHIWEVAGPPSLVTRFSTDPNVFLPTARPAVVLITVDLSQPVAAVQSAMHWLGVIGQHTMHDGGQHVLAGPGGVGGDAIQQCMALWDAQHPDILARAVTITGVLVCLCCACVYLCVLVFIRAA